MNLITTHVLDTTVGRPVAGVAVILEYRETLQRSCTVIGQDETDVDGRLQYMLTAEQATKPGVYCLRFDTSKLSPFFPEIIVQFVISDTQQHYHVPLLLTRFGYTTYRGS